MAHPRKDPWPSVDDGSETAIDRDKVKKLIKALEQDLKKYEKHAGNGTPHMLTQDLNQIKSPDVGGDANPKGYPGGRLIWSSIQNVQKNYPSAYKEFLATYKTVIAALYESAGIMDKAESDSTPTPGGAHTSNSNRSGRGGTGAYNNDPQS